MSSEGRPGPDPVPLTPRMLCVKFLRETQSKVKRGLILVFDTSVCLY